MSIYKNVKYSTPHKNFTFQVVFETLEIQYLPCLPLARALLRSLNHDIVIRSPSTSLLSYLKCGIQQASMIMSFCKAATEILLTASFKLVSQFAMSQSLVISIPAEILFFVLPFKHNEIEKTIQQNVIL